MPKPAKKTARPRKAPKRAARPRKLRLEDLEGEGFFDWVKDTASKVVNKVKDVFTPSNRYNNTSKKTLEQFGDGLILKMEAVRTPVKQALTRVLDVVSLGRFSQLAREQGHDKFFHLGLLLTLAMPNGVQKKVLYEKNAQLNITTDLSSLTAETEYLPVNLQGKNITLKDFALNTQKLAGDERYFVYDAFSSNCQVAIIDALQGNGLLTPELKKWVWQDLGDLASKLPFVTRWLSRAATDAGAAVERLVGKGKVPIRLRKIKGGSLYHVYSQGGARITKHGLPLPMIKRALKTK